MREYLRTSKLTDPRAFIHSFVKEIKVRPGTVVIVYTIFTLDDSPKGKRTPPNWFRTANLSVGGPDRGSRMGNLGTALSERAREVLLTTQ